MNTHEDIQLNKIIVKDHSAESGITSVITDIYWERINFFITIDIEAGSNDSDVNEDTNKDIDIIKSDIPDSPDLYAVTSFNTSNARLHLVKHDGNKLTYSLNITNPGYCLCLPDETYRFYLCHNDAVVSKPAISEELTSRLADISRSFLYSKKKSTYTVDFSVGEETTGLHLIMRVLNAKRSPIARFTEPAAGHSRRKLPIKKSDIQELIRKYYRHTANKFDKGYDGTPRTILFMSEQSETLGDNLQAVLDRMKERDLDKRYKIMTSARSAVSKHYGQASWHNLIKSVAEADIIFVDDHCPFLDWLTLVPRTRLIQLWHAGAGFKSSGYSRWGRTGCPGPSSGHRQYDYGITTSTRISHFYSEVFGINPEQLLPTGMPRMDIYLDPSHREAVTAELKTHYPIAGKKVILFAPTYRGKNRKDAHYPYEQIDFKRLANIVSDDTVILFKMHPWVDQPVPIPEKFKDMMFDVSDYPSINDLFYITDLLISDYSSDIFEFSLMKKPMLFFAFDEKQYSYSRGFHRPYEESAPGKVCRTFDELLNAIESRDFQQEKVEQYVKLHFDRIDSYACDRVIDWFITDGIPEKYAKRINSIKEDNKHLKALDFSLVHED